MSNPEMDAIRGNAFRPASMRDLTSYVSPEEIIDLGDDSVVLPETDLDALLDEYSAMDWGDEIDLTDATVVEEANDVTKQASEMQPSDILNSVGHGENDDSTSGPQAGSHGQGPIPPLFPQPNLTDKPLGTTPPKSGEHRRPEASTSTISTPKTSNETDTEPIQVFTDEIPKTIDPVMEEFEREFEGESYIKTHTQETQTKRPGLLKLAKLALLKHRYDFDTPYFTQHGSDIPRNRILRGHVRYIETRPKQERSHKLSVRHKIGAVAISAISLVAGIGIGAGVVSNHSNESRNTAGQTLVVPNANYYQAVSTTETPTTTTVKAEQSTLTMPEMNAEQQKAFADMCQWIQENPGIDFVSALNTYIANTANS